MACKKSQFTSISFQFWAAVAVESLINAGSVEACGAFSTGQSWALRLKFYGFGFYTTVEVKSFYTNKIVCKQNLNCTSI